MYESIIFELRYLNNLKVDFLHFILTYKCRDNFTFESGSIRINTFIHRKLFSFLSKIYLYDFLKDFFNEEKFSMKEVFEVAAQLRIGSENVKI